MLPGFRFLFATVVLAASVLIFGVGAAALLRSAHEEFASLPSWHPPQQPLLPPQADSRPTLAMLRVETPPAVPLAATPAAPDSVSSEDKPQSVATRNDDAATATDTAQAPVADQPPAATSDTLYEQATPESPAPQAQNPSSPDVQSSTPSEAQGTPDTPAPPQITSSVAGASEGNSSDPKASDPRANNGAVTESAPDTKESEASTIQSVAPQIHSTQATATLTIPGKPAARKVRRPSAEAVTRRRQAARARAAARAAARTSQQKPAQTQSFLFGS